MIGKGASTLSVLKPLYDVLYSAFTKVMSVPPVYSVSCRISCTFSSPSDAGSKARSPTDGVISAGEGVNGGLSVSAASVGNNGAEAAFRM